MSVKYLSIFLFFFISLDLAAGPRCFHSHDTDKLDQLLAEIEFDTLNRPINDNSRLSDRGLFRIHYLTTGENAPADLDIDQNGYPDYVDSVAYYFDYTYMIEVETLGFLSPMSEVSGIDLYDVYLWNLGDGNPGFYGQTFPIEQIKPNKANPRYTSYIVVDNDFSPLDSSQGNNGRIQTFNTFGYDALKVTVAHEFHHAIQNMYGIDKFTAVMFMESTSVLMEFLLFPEIKDYFQYIDQLFKNPAEYPFGYKSNRNSIGPYAYSIFMIYLVERFGTEIILSAWENILEGHNNYYSYDLALKDRGSNMDDAWCEFRIWCYYTGDRAIENSYFEYAEDYPEIAFNNQPYDTISKPSFARTGTMKPYELRYYRVLFKNSGNVSDDTLDVLMGSYDIEAARFNLGRDLDYSLAVSEQDIPGSNPIDGIPFYYFFDAPSNKICENIKLNRGSANFAIAHAYPNPFREREGDALYFPAPGKAILYDKVSLSIYTTDMYPVYQEEMEVEANNGNLVVRLSNMPDQIKSGVHIFSVKFEEEFLLGKIAVIRE